MDQPTGTDRAAWIAPSAELYGDIRLREDVSIWPKVVMRAEAAFIEVGACSNIQDFVMIHYGNDCPSIIGEYCSITHHATVHGATVGDHCLIGINATLMDGCVIGENSIVAGHSIVSEGTVVPPNSVVAGVPAKVIGERNNRLANRLNAVAYLENARAYARGNYRRWSEADYKENMRALMAQWASEPDSASDRVTTTEKNKGKRQ